MFKKLLTVITASAIATVAYANSAQAAGFKRIRIGDRDGFGYGTGQGYQGAYGGNANVDGRGMLGVGDLLPDLNMDGKLATGSKDDFDNRSRKEKRSNYITGSGFTDNGSSGSQFTDISLSTSFIKTNKNKKNYNLKKKRFTQADVSNSKVPLPNLNFNFSVDGNDIKQGTDMYFNMLFGDYDVKNAEVEFTRADGSKFTSQLTKQQNNQGQDGLIQSAFVKLNFGDIFTSTNNGYNGSLQAKIIAKDEPYLTFDFAELSTNQISLDAQDVPEPSIALGILALSGGMFLRKGKKRKSH